MRNLIGYFKGGSGCTDYSIKIISNSGSSEFEEIYLAGESPVVVTYDVSNTPFDPIRQSRATISVVADDKLLDVFSSEAQGTQVILTNLGTGENEWVGYLTNNLLNMPQDLCGYDNFSVEAQDCLMTLDKYHYHTIGSHKSIVTFRQILGQIAERCGLITDMYIDNSMQRSDGSYIEMGSLKISEQNFFSSDTDESWTLKEVLEEMCKYLGYTASQYKESLYLFDLQSHSDTSWQTDLDAQLSMNGYRYQKSSGWNSYTQGSFTNLAKGITLRQGIVRGTGSNISLETIYNKVQVKDSFYEIDHFIPNMFEDKLLTNRDGDFWKCRQISRTGKFSYINNSGDSKKEEKDEYEHVYYIRKFDHDNYTPIYRDKDTLAEVGEETGGSGVKVTTADSTQKTIDQITGEGTYTVTATFKNYDNVSHNIYAYAELRYDWYDGQRHTYLYNADNDGKRLTIAAGGTLSVYLQCNATYDTAYLPQASYESWYTVDGNTQRYGITSEGGTETSDYIGATITDLATFDKPMSTAKYNFETESDINFDRYIMIHQNDKPTGRMHPYWAWYLNNGITPLEDSQIENIFPAIMRLNSGYYNPMIIDNKAYLALNTTAIYERYNVEYINPDWTDENSSIGGLGLFKKKEYTTTVVPALIFKLKIGNKYWSSQSGWTTTDSCFVVNLGTDKTDNDDTDYTGWWNKDHATLNNIDWTEWAGVSGYKIPLDPSLDFTSEIGFWIMMPSKLQAISTTKKYDGVNNYCWIKDFNFEVATKMSEQHDLADVLYENIIDSGSTNTLSDITVKYTTYPGEGKHSYSSVALDGTLLTKMKKVGQDDAANFPEENIIKSYANQYNTPTIKQVLTLKSYISPFSLIKDPTLDNKYFGILGTTIDYANDSQTMTLCELKPWHS